MLKLLRSRITDLEAPYPGSTATSAERRDWTDWR